MKDLVLTDFENLPAMGLEETRDFIALVEATAKQSEDQIEIPLDHYFSAGVYAREVKLPAGSLCVGKIHKKENLNILSSGEVSILSIEGVRRVKAPYTFVSPPGVKRVAYAHVDSTWTTIHGTDSRDLDEIEDEFIAKNYDELQLEAKEI